VIVVQGSIHSRENTMSKLQNLLPVGFVLAVLLTACNNDRDGVDTAASRKATTAPTDATAVTRNAGTPVQPNAMPSPEAPSGPVSKDSAVTKPLNELTLPKESATMPEALHGNNHSSPALDPTNRSGTAPTAVPPPNLKKSSMVLPKARKVVWI